NGPFSGYQSVSKTIRIRELKDDVIPSSHNARTLVLCFDGTGDQFDKDNSNVVQFFSTLKKDDPSQQMVYYQAGIGAYGINSQIGTPFMTALSKTIAMIVGKSLDTHVMDGYMFLMQNYEVGDKICLFGFSRGAYTARALAGIQSDDDPANWKLCNEFKKTFSIDVDIEFVGVWDTVNAVGVIPHSLPFTKSNNKIRYFRHALSLDEHRGRFRPIYYQKSTEIESQLGLQDGEMPRSCKMHQTVHNPIPNEYTTDGEPKVEVLGDHSSEPIVKTDFEEVWFAGCHCDVGGGSDKNGVRYSLARIPLRWMIRECFKTNSGILFHGSKLRKVGLDPATLYPHVLARPPAISPSKSIIDGGPNTECTAPFENEELEDCYDAFCRINDQLDIRPYWWILEYLPQCPQDEGNDDKKKADFCPNAGRGRRIPKAHKGVKWHRTVQMRINNPPFGVRYLPKAELDPDAVPIWVD
ncbi:hypothetical protein ID866_8400, partial [Astraeus odoratus]